MGYFDGVANSNFKKTSDGRTIFYPYALFASGYEVSSDQERKVKKFFKAYSALSMIIGVFSVVFLPAYYLPFVLVGYLLLYSFSVKILLANAVKTNERMNFSERIKNTAISMGKPASFSLLALSILLVFITVVYVYHVSNLISCLSLIIALLSLIYTFFLAKYSLK